MMFHFGFYNMLIIRINSLIVPSFFVNLKDKEYLFLMFNVFLNSLANFFTHYKELKFKHQPRIGLFGTKNPIAVTVHSIIFYQQQLTPNC